jgi:hypothetical protein
MKTFQQIGTAAGELVEEKNRAYGSSFATAGTAMRLLYPNGIAPEQMHDALVLVRIWDKLMRIATDRDALGESPYHDIIGYGILGVHMHQATEGEPQAPCGSVSAKAAANESQAPSDSAAPSAPHSTTPSASAKSANSSEKPSSPESPSTSASTGALASTAMVAAVFGSASESHLRILTRDEVLDAAKRRNDDLRCAHCGSPIQFDGSPIMEIIDSAWLYFHTQECVAIFRFSLGGQA